MKLKFDTPHVQSRSLFYSIRFFCLMAGLSLASFPQLSRSDTPSPIEPTLESFTGDSDFSSLRYYQYYTENSKPRFRYYSVYPEAITLKDEQYYLAETTSPQFTKRQFRLLIKTPSPEDNKKFHWVPHYPTLIVSLHRNLEIPSALATKLITDQAANYRGELKPLTQSGRLLTFSPADLGELKQFISFLESSRIKKFVKNYSFDAEGLISPVEYSSASPNPWMIPAGVGACPNKTAEFSEANCLVLPENPEVPTSRRIQLYTGFIRPFDANKKTIVFANGGPGSTFGTYVQDPTLQSFAEHYNVGQNFY